MGLIDDLRVLFIGWETSLWSQQQVKKQGSCWEEEGQAAAVKTYTHISLLWSEHPYYHYICNLFPTIIYLKSWKSTNKHIFFLSFIKKKFQHVIFRGFLTTYHPLHFKCSIDYKLVYELVIEPSQAVNCPCIILNGEIIKRTKDWSLQLEK
jgi:hypothetical protein